jgi:hypothetical protein
MKKIATAAVAFATLATVAVGSATQAEAHHWHRHGYGYGGGAVAAGLVGGLILGGVIAQASAPRRCYTRVVGYDRWGNEVVRRSCRY